VHVHREKLFVIHSYITAILTRFVAI